MKNDLNTPGIFEHMMLDIGNRLKAIVSQNGKKIVKTVDEWNNQWAYLDKEKPFEFPSVFVEFAQFPWRSIGGRVQMATGLVNLHIGIRTSATSRHGHQQTSTYYGNARVVDAIYAALNGWGSETGYMGSWSRVNSQRDADHDDIIAHIETYRFTVKDTGAMPSCVSVEGDKLVVEIEE